MTYFRIHVHICCTHAHVYASAWANVCSYLCMHTHAYTRMHAFTCTHVHTHMPHHVHACTLSLTHTHTHTHTLTLTHTHTHTHIHTLIHTYIQHTYIHVSLPSHLYEDTPAHTPQPYALLSLFSLHHVNNDVYCRYRPHSSLGRRQSPEPFGDADFRDTSLKAYTHDVLWPWPVVFMLPQYCAWPHVACGIDHRSIVKNHGGCCLGVLLPQPSM